MSSEIETPLVKSGVSAVYTKETFEENKKIDLTAAATYTLAANQPSEIENRFIDTPQLAKQELDSGDMVVVHDPTGSYSPGSLQVIVVRNEIVNHWPIELKNGRVPTRSIYDFTPETQLAYFHQILKVQRAMKEEFVGFVGGKFHVLFTENCAKTVSDEEHRVARTIAEPHTQIWIINGHSTPFNPSETPRLLRHERAVIKILKNKIMTGMIALASDLASVTNQKFDFAVRAAPPFGYVINTPITESMPMKQQTELLTTLMRAHHERYTKEAEKLMGDLADADHKHAILTKMLFPQPSYKVYGVFGDDGHLSISIAPSLFAAAGVVEGLDRQIYRSKENLPFFESSETETQYYGAVANRLALTE